MLRHIILMLTLLTFAGQLLAESAPVPAAMRAWKYRMAIQVINRKTATGEAVGVTLSDFPFLTWINDGKLRADLRDLRLLDEHDEPVACAPYHPLSDNGDAALIFTVPPLKGLAKRTLFLYYGNPAAAADDFADEMEPAEHPDLSVALGREESRSTAPQATAGALDRWLASHLLLEAERANAPTGYAVQKPADPAKRLSGGGVLAPTGAAAATAVLTTTVPGGTTMCWLRYSPASGAQIPRGSLTMTVGQKEQPLAGKSIDLTTVVPEDGDPTAFRWVGVKVLLAKGPVTVTISADKASAQLDCLAFCTDLTYLPDARDFAPRVWVRWRAEGAVDYPHWMLVQPNTQPYSPTGTPVTGILSGRGFEPRIDTPTSLADDDYLHVGQATPWIQLPADFGYTGYVLFSLQGKAGVAFPDKLALRFEFANRPSTAHVFRITPSTPVSRPHPPAANYGRASVGVHMPEAYTLDAMRTVETFPEWAKRLRGMIEGMKLGPPPRLTRLRVGTWSYYMGGGDAQAAEDFPIFEMLGINQLGPSYLGDATFGRLARAHGIIDAMLMTWGHRTATPAQAQQKFQPGETPEQFWPRVYDDYYRKLADYYRANAPEAYALTTHFNMGDEIGMVINGELISKDPVVTACFHAWLQRQGVTPQELGVAEWNAVAPLDDRAKLPDGDLSAAKRYYYTRRFMDYYFILAWGSATRAVQAHFPKARVISANYQAGPMQSGFLGTSWSFDFCMMDLFAYTRAGAFKGILLEDWISTRDLGVTHVNFGTELMRAVTRKTKTPAALLLVTVGQGPGAQRAKFFSSLMHGIKENDIFLYGPINHVGPAFAGLPGVIKEYAETTRFMKKFEQQIADGAPRQRKAAMLLAYSTDLMQARGIYPFPERQRLHMALEHSAIPVDFICEQEILDDEILAQYSLLYLSDTNVPLRVQQKIADWVKNGGRLWASVGAANWDEFNRPSTVLDPVFGVKSRGMITQAAWPPTGSILGPVPVRLNYAQVDTVTAASPLLGNAVKLPAWGMKLACEPSTAQVLATYGDGKPAVLLNAFGQGEAMLVGALVGDAYSRQHYAVGQDTPAWQYASGADARRFVEIMADRAPGVRQYAQSVPGIYSMLWDVPGGSLFFISNAARAGFWELPANLPVPPSVTVRLLERRKILSIDSARFGKVAFTQKDGEVVFTCATPTTDILMLRIEK